MLRKTFYALQTRRPIVAKSSLSAAGTAANKQQLEEDMFDRFSSSSSKGSSGGDAAGNTLNKNRRRYGFDTTPSSSSPATHKGAATPTTTTTQKSSSNVDESPSASGSPSSSPLGDSEDVPRQFRAAAKGEGDKAPTLSEQWEMTNVQVNSLLQPLLKRSPRFRELHEHFWGMTALMCAFHVFFTVVVYQLEKREYLSFLGFQRGATMIWKTFGESLDLKGRRWTVEDKDPAIPLLGIKLPISKELASNVNMSHGIALQFFGLFYILPIYIFYPRVIRRWGVKNMKTASSGVAATQRQGSGGIAAIMDKKKT